MLRKLTLFYITAALFLTAAAQGQVFKPEDYAATRLALSTASLMEETPAAPQLQMNETFCCQKKYFWVAAGELVALQVIPWYFNRHVADDTTADLSFKSWGHNLRAGMEWDPNAFSGNMFQHPFHGNLFYNTARSNGYTYWESVPFAFAGSMMWEMFGENNLGAINDWVMTSMGGITIGEGLHRAAIMLRDNTARGATRTFRELGAFLFDPVGGFNRVVRGEWTKYGPNPENRFSSGLHTYTILGYRAIGDGGLKNSGDALTFGYMQMDYGNPMEDYERPFDAFRLNLQLNSGKEKTRMGQVSIYGVLYGSEIKNTEKVTHVFTIEQMFDYLNNFTYEIGGQSFAFGVRSIWNLSERTGIHTIAQGSIFPMTGIISEPTLIGDRDYDFGSGYGLRLGGSYVRSGFEYFSLAYRGVFSHTLNGTAGNQIVHFVSSRLQYPLWRSVGIGVEYILYMRESYFRDYPDIHRRNPELRIGVTFTWK